MGAKGLAIGTAIAAIAVGGCGSGKEPPPLKEVPQTQTQTTGTAAVPATQTEDTITNLGPRYNRVFAPLMDARESLDNGAATVTAAATAARTLAAQIAAGNNPPGGSAPQVTRLRDALSAFGDMLHTIVTSSTQLPRLSAELQTRAAKLSKRNPEKAAALLTAKQEVDAAIAEVGGLDGAIAVAEGKVREQVSRVALDADPLQTAATSASENSAAAAAKVDDAVDSGFRALVEAS